MRKDVRTKCCQAPLLIPPFSLLPSSSTWIGRIISVLLYTALDLLCADCLFGIAASGAAQVSRLYVSPRKERAWKSISVAAVCVPLLSNIGSLILTQPSYLFNPYTFLTCLGRPTTVFTTFFVLLSINHACQAKLTTSAFALAIASYMSLHPAFLLPPIGLLCYDQLYQRETRPTSNEPTPPPTTKTTLNQASFPNATTFTLHLTASFTLSTAFLLALSRLLLPSSQFLPSLYLTPLQLPDLTPNSGVWWYFFTEMFDPFRSFFLGVFWLHMGSYSVPFSLRFRKQPLAAVVFMMGVCVVFQPYPCAGDAGVWLSCLGLLGHVFERGFISI